MLPALPAPRLPPGTQGYDGTLIPLVVTIAAVSAAAAGGLAALLLLHARARLYAAPLSFHADVLRQR